MPQDSESFFKALAILLNSDNYLFIKSEVIDNVMLNVSLYKDKITALYPQEIRKNLSESSIAMAYSKL